MCASTQIPTEIQIRAHPIHVSISKERKKLITTGEVREYKRVRGYVELHEDEALEEWVAIQERDFVELVKLLKHFVDLIESERVRVEISKDKYPTLWKALREYEESNPAWFQVLGVPRIYLDVLKPLLILPGDADKVVREHELSVDPEQLKDEVWDLIEEVDDKVYEAFRPLGLSEIESCDPADYSEWIWTLRFGGVTIYKRGFEILGKGKDGYVLEVTFDGSTSFANADIFIR